jgi:hypothetical protein
VGTIKLNVSYSSIESIGDQNLRPKHTQAMIDQRMRQRLGLRSVGYEWNCWHLSSVRVIFYRDGAILMGHAKIRIRAEARLPGSVAVSICSRSMADGCEMYMSTACSSKTKKTWPTFRSLVSRRLVDSIHRPPVSFAGHARISRGKSWLTGDLRCACMQPQGWCGLVLCHLTRKS